MFAEGGLGGDRKAPQENIMFGYIAPVLSVMDEDQKRRYRGVYCGVCQSLRNISGAGGRSVLSNDLTFLAMLLNSLYEPETELRERRCAVHPLKTHPCQSSEMIRYAAEMNILLSWYKFQDSWMDDHAVSGRAGQRWLRKAAEEVRARHPAQSKAVEDALTKLWAAEKEAHPSPDLLCNLSGAMLGAVFVPRPEDLWAEHLYAVGAGLGRFVYWMDAWEDYAADQRRHRFNPLTGYHDRPDYEAFCKETLELFLAEAAEHFELLPLEKDLDLLRNVLYSGVWQRYWALNHAERGKGDAPDQ